MYLLLEYCPYGELYQLLEKNGSLTEDTSLYYFHQLIEVLECCHNSGFTHGDLKPENILIGKHLEIKLIDFGSSSKIGSNDYEWIGTEQYLPPEVRLGLECDPIKGDLFVVGMLLFIMYVGCPPFNIADTDDSFYSMIANHNTQRFWAFFQKKRPEKVFSDAFKQIIEGLLEFDPQVRMNYSQIKESVWYQTTIDETYIQEQIQNQFFS